MKFAPTKISGVWLVQLECYADERGHFARTWCEKEFAAAGLNPHISQCSTSFNLKQGTLRGLHFQIAPHAEDKLVRCTRGAIFDVAVDLRPGSPTFKQWLAMELTDTNGYSLYIPKGFAHGFMTLADNSEIFYQMSQSYHAPSSRTLHWNDRELDIHWPATPQVISDRDQNAPPLVALLEELKQTSP